MADDKTTENIWRKCGRRQNNRKHYGESVADDKITEKYGTSVADDKTITQKYHRNLENWIN